ncbi:uncharacterized protein LOC130645092 [Hydractinia symbiolongicarpus]|uniref:uncharacterized protein LOC130645092 n=1 Tax=Hydractinia symbiolongicarpus TaxID=13093 RepID=UPI00254BDD84|nr:uncharacterized protein LOC130645092 [Hydractinia symbiolongicarpus]
MALCGERLMLAFFISLLVSTLQFNGLPLLSARIKRTILNRENVKALQLQTMLKSLDKNTHSETVKPATVKREAKGHIGDDKHLTRLFGEHIPWDIVRRQVPFDALITRNKARVENKNLQSEAYFNKKNSSPCRRKRDTSHVSAFKRNVNTPVGEGIVPAYNMYDELCEDSQPVEVVKIKKLVVEDGVIRDQNIIEKAMFA